MMRQRRPARSPGCPRSRRRLVDHRGATDPRALHRALPLRRRRVTGGPRRRLTRRAAAWQVLLVTWAEFGIGAAAVGWRLIGPASVCCPLLMAGVLVGLGWVALTDMRQQIAAARDGWA